MLLPAEDCQAWTPTAASSLSSKAAYTAHLFHKIRKNPAWKQDPVTDGPHLLQTSSMLPDRHILAIIPGSLRWLSDSQ